MTEKAINFPKGTLEYAELLAENKKLKERVKELEEELKSLKSYQKKGEENMTEEKVEEVGAELKARAEKYSKEHNVPYSEALKAVAPTTQYSKQTFELDQIARGILGKKFGAEKALEEILGKYYGDYVTALKNVAKEDPQLISGCEDLHQEAITLMEKGNLTYLEAIIKAGELNPELTEKVKTYSSQGLELRATAELLMKENPGLSYRDALSRVGYARNKGITIDGELLIDTVKLHQIEERVKTM